MNLAVRFLLALLLAGAAPAWADVNSDDAVGRPAWRVMLLMLVTA